jgi:hypothetical protein
MIHGLSISTPYRSQTRPEGPTNTSTSTVAMASTGPTATPKICSTQASVFHGNSAFSAGIWWPKTGKATIVRISHYKTDPSVKEKDTTSNGCVLDSPQYVCSALFGFASHTTRAMVVWNLQSCLVMNYGQLSFIMNCSYSLLLKRRTPRAMGVHKILSLCLHSEHFEIQASHIT